MHKVLASHVDWALTAAHLSAGDGVGEAKVARAARPGREEDEPAILLVYDAYNYLMDVEKTKIEESCEWTGDG